MKEVIFPGFNINLKINSVAITIGSINIYWYSILIVIAFLVGILFCKKQDGRYKIKYENILEVIIMVIPVSIICARGYFVLFKLQYYIKNPLEIINIQDGGLAIYGGILGGLVTIAIYCKKKKINLLDILDYVVPYLPLGQTIGRWGNFFNVEAYGQTSTNIFRMGIIENGKYIEVHPTFLYESIASFMIFIILYILKDKRKYKGQITYIYLALYGLIRAYIEGLRADSLMVLNLKISQIISILLFCIFTFIIIKRKVGLYNRKNFSQANRLM